VEGRVSDEENPRRLKKVRTYTCWQCHRKGYAAESLISHRCLDCRTENRAVVSENPKLGDSAWTTEGQQAWVRFNGLGVNGGVKWRVRKKKIGEDEAVNRLKKLKRLPTWNDKSS